MDDKYDIDLDIVRIMNRIRRYCTNVDCTSECPFMVDTKTKDCMFKHIPNDHEDRTWDNWLFRWYDILDNEEE